MPSRRYIKRRNMSMLISTRKWLKLHVKYDFLTHGAPIYLRIKYRNFAQSTFKKRDNKKENAFLKISHPPPPPYKFAVYVYTVLVNSTCVEVIKNFDFYTLLYMLLLLVPFLKEQSHSFIVQSGSLKHSPVPKYNGPVP